MSKFLQVSKRLAGFFLLSAHKHEGSEVVAGYDIIQRILGESTGVLLLVCFETSVRGEEEDLSGGVHDSLLLWQPWEESDGAS